MDQSDLEHATGRWVEAGLIDEETAASIVAFENERTDGGFLDHHLARIVAGMGAILIGAGVLTFLATQWADLGTVVRSAILVFAPLAAGVGGILGDRRGLAVAGRALWNLGAILLGPCAYLLLDVHAVDVSTQWILLGWGIVAVAMGHAFLTRPATGGGLLVVLAAIVDIGAGDTGFFAAAALGVVVLTAAAIVPVRQRLANTYRLVGVIPLVVTLLWLNTMEGNVSPVGVEWGPLLGGAGVLAVASLLAAARWRTPARGDLVAGTVLLVGVALSLLVVEGLASVHHLAVYLLVQAILLGVLLGIAVAAIALGERVLINFVVLGFLVQVVTLLVTIVDQLPGTIALVAAGIVLLAAAVALERGRKRIIQRLATG